MTVEIIRDVEQSTPEWYELRRGMVTASEMACVLRTEGKAKGSPSVTRRKYMLRLAAERLGAELPESFTNGHMERGKAREDEARRSYAFITRQEPERVAFVRNHGLNAGCSPDALIGDNGILEIKTKLPDLQIEALLAGEVPAEHIPQVQALAYIAEREFVDFVSYWPGLAPLIVRAPRDEQKIAEIADATARFNDELAAMVEDLRRFGSPAMTGAAA